MSLLKNRTPLSRPRAYGERMRETLPVLDRIRVDPVTSVVTISTGVDDEPRDVAAGQQQTTPVPLRPSIAALQLYLLNEQRNGITYIDRPLANAQAVADNLRRAAVLAGDIAATDTVAALAKQNEFERRYPNLYVLFRIVMLEKLGGLVPVPLSTSITESTYRRLLATFDQAEREFGRAERSLIELNQKLLAGNQLSMEQLNQTQQQLAAFVIDSVEPAWKSVLPAPESVVAVKMERFAGVQG